MVAMNCLLYSCVTAIKMGGLTLPEGGGGGGVADQATGQRACILIGSCNQVAGRREGEGEALAMRGFVAKSCFVSEL